MNVIGGRHGMVFCASVEENWEGKEGKKKISNAELPTPRLVYDRNEHRNAATISSKKCTAKEGE
jgi:hypothetical protein